MRHTNVKTYKSFGELREAILKQRQLFMQQRREALKHDQMERDWRARERQKGVR